MSDRYIVVGNPIGHSLSPRIHTLFAAQTGQDMVYTAQLAPLDGFAATVTEFAAAGGRGLNVTLPFKQQAFRLATRLSERARLAGSVNTLSCIDGGLAADNTDGAGLVGDLRRNLACSIAGRRVLLLGAGGAARGVVRPLCLEQPAQLTIANRNAETARQLAADCSTAALQVTGGSFAELAGLSFDLVINATSASLHDTGLDLPAGVFAPGSLAYDMVYGRNTAFMRQAQQAGAAHVADGLGMLIEQAAEAFRIWRGICPDTAPVLKELRLALAGKKP